MHRMKHRTNVPIKGPPGVDYGKAIVQELKGQGIDGTVLEPPPELPKVSKAGFQQVGSKERQKGGKTSKGLGKGKGHTATAPKGISRSQDSGETQSWPPTGGSRKSKDSNTGTEKGSKGKGKKGKKGKGKGKNK